ncbi:MAG TPA: glycosyltransferase family 4 protein [Thermoanaerobaculia bacterium]
MKIAVLTADYPPDVWSGIGVAVQRQVSELEKLGAEVQVVVARSRDAAIPAIGPVDWIHLHSLPLAELALELRRRTGARLAYTVHTQPWLEWSGNGRARFWLDTQARLLGACDRALFLSDAEHAAAQTLFPHLPPAAVIPNGVPAPPHELPGRDARPFIVFAGRFAASKGMLLLEEIVRLMKPRTSLRFVLAGGHGDDEGTAAAQRLARHCDVRGWLPRAELDALFGAARLVLVPSRYEPFGLVALEAMRMGAPVLASSTGGLRAFRDAAMMLDGRDAHAWSDAALRIASDEQAWHELHTRGPRFVGERYRPCDVAKQLWDVLASA